MANVKNVINLLTLLIVENALFKIATYNDFGCVACECAFYITPNNVCKSMREGCIRYLRGKCIDCLPSWRLKGNDCILPGCQHN